MVRKTLMVMVALLVLFVGFQIVTFPRVSRLREENPSTTAFMDRRRAELRAAGKDDQIRYSWVSYERISPHLRSAVIVSEDSRFYDHKGVDTVELEKILREAWEKRELERGGSTITQQLAKNLYLSRSRNPWRKIKELLIAKRMEQVLEKKRILELYLNVVELGERVYGAEAASRHYFGKPASSLTPAEAALLAGALPNPRKMNPGSPGPYLRRRRDIILSRMRRWGYMVERSVAHQPDPPPNEPYETDTTDDSEVHGTEPSQPTSESTEEHPPGGGEDPYRTDEEPPPDLVPAEPGEKPPPSSL